MASQATVLERPSAPEPEDSVREAGLRYVSDERPGIRRRRRGRGFEYVGPEGEPLEDPETLGRIRALAVPPAWTDVWICPNPCGHIQATGRDARGRKQYRYHPKWREARDATKYDGMVGFGQALPTIRERTEQDLARHDLPKEKVLATVVRLLEGTLIRVGNDEYARDNNSYGLTTMRDRHAVVEGPNVEFRYRGKGGRIQTATVQDRRLARIVKRCQDLPGQELFQYLDEDGAVQDVDSADVNDYLREITGQDLLRRTSAPGPVRSPPRGRSRSSRPSIPKRRRSATSCGPSRPWRTAWATRRPSAASATCIPRCWRPIWRDQSSKPCASGDG